MSEHLTPSNPTGPPAPQSYQYKMIQIAPSIIVQSHAENGQEAAQHLEQIVNQWSAAGWEFYRVDTMNIYTPGGCLGGQATITNYHVVTFRRLR